eukprot:TRINITY_DN67287_c6_g3_i1.p1 TRINITY_DN67287_c6_g3~~TRINITY_DN67287_c6_g3_i1.p1  ORF type:complete len:960 (-),score=128.43 TRINITY_DN67287_c6_g3_i1:59-2584(-)
MAAEALRAIFLTILPPNQTLTAFTDQRFDTLPQEQEGNQQALDDRHTVLFHWYIEDVIQKAFIGFLSGVETATKDTVESHRSFFVSLLGSLLEKIPEQGPKMLTILVNKLGDQVPKVASKAMYLVVSLTENIPRLQSQVIDTVQDFLFIGNNTTRARMYGVDVLNSCIPLVAPREWRIANKLLGVYFAMFKYLVRQEQVENKMMQRLFTGVKRIFPKTRASSDTVQSHLRACFVIAATASFPHRVVALAMLFQILKHSHKMDFSKQEKRKMTQLQAAQAENKHLDDEQQQDEDETPANDEKQKNQTQNGKTKNAASNATTKKTQPPPKNNTHGTTSTHTTTTSSSSSSSASSAIVRELEKTFFDSTTFRVRFYSSLYFLLRERPENMPTQAGKIAALFSLMYNALLTDNNQQRVSAFVHRLLQVCTHHSPSFCCGSIYMIEELAKKHTYLTELLLKQRQKAPPTEEYNPLQRRPELACAQHENTWLTSLLTSHYHPQVVRFSTFVVSSVPIDYEGDPLEDFTVPKFLDTFVFKRPKSKVKDEIKEGQQKKKQKNDLSISSTAFAKLPPNQVELNKMFAYKWATQKRDLWKRSAEVTVRRDHELGHKKSIASRREALHNRDTDGLWDSLPAEGDDDDEDVDDLDDIEIDENVSMNSSDSEIAGAFDDGFDDDMDDDEFFAPQKQALTRQERRRMQREMHSFDPTRGSMKGAASAQGGDLNQFAMRKERGVGNNKDKKRKRKNDSDDDDDDDAGDMLGFDVDDDWSLGGSDDGGADEDDEEEDTVKAKKRVVRKHEPQRLPPSTVKKVVQKREKLEPKKVAAGGLSAQVSKFKAKTQDSRLWE